MSRPTQNGLSLCRLAEFAARQKKESNTMTHRSLALSLSLSTLTALGSFAPALAQTSAPSASASTPDAGTDSRAHSHKDFDRIGSARSRRRRGAVGRRQPRSIRLLQFGVPGLGLSHSGDFRAAGSLDKNSIKRVNSASSCSSVRSGGGSLSRETQHCDKGRNSFRRFHHGLHRSNAGLYLPHFGGFGNRVSHPNIRGKRNTSNGPCCQSQPDDADFERGGSSPEPFLPGGCS